MNRGSRPILLILVSLLLAPLAAASEPAARIPVGEVFNSEILGFPGEAFPWPQSAREALLSTPIDGKVTLVDFPVAPGARRDIELERYDVYGPGAEMIVDDGRSQRQIPRSPRLHFLGRAVDDPDIRVGFSVDPRLGTVRGLSSSSEGTFEILEPAVAGERHLIQHPGIADEGFEPFAEASCGTEHLPKPEGYDAAHASPAAALPRELGELTKGATLPLLSAVIAIDTDNELNHLKFSNDTGAALAWISDLFDAMNVMYEADLGLRLLQGTTILRLDTDPSPAYDDDPWQVDEGGLASSNHLHEFGNYWAGNHDSIERVMAVFLSGKGSGGGYSGIAWINGICEKQNIGGAYSVNIIGPSVSATSGAPRLVGHELGHNFGSDHTHCYTPPVDTCFSGEFGCYTGPISCPGGSSGTIMSYCHRRTGSNCGQNRLQFHPTVIANLSGQIAAHTFPGCIVELVFNDGFEAGTTFAWSSQVP